MIVIKGAGDIASGVALRLASANMPFMMTDLPFPTAIRRTVSFSEAVLRGETAVEGVRAVRARSADEAYALIDAGVVPVLVDPDADIVNEVRPTAVVDAILAKKNTGTRISDASAVIALGPGFCAGNDCHAVIETMRGHTLGRMILSGSAIPNTGVPGLIGGYADERIIRAPRAGVFFATREIGDVVKAGEVVATVEGEPVIARIAGVLRGILPSGALVHEGMKSGDVDPRCAAENCRTTSDKALAIGGGALAALLYFANKNFERESLWKTR